VERVAGRYTRDGRPGGRVPVQRRGPGESYLAQHPHAPVVWLWRHRWPLAPVVVAAGTVAGASHVPMATGLTLAGAAGLFQVGASWPRVRTIGGRAWLSTKERRTAAIGLVAAAGWVGITDAVPGLGWRARAVLLAAVLGVPAWQWWAARRVRGGKLSALAARLVADWPVKVAGPGGPKPLRGSSVVAPSVAEPVEGTVVMTVRLDGVHPTTATTTPVRQAVEVALGMPLDSVRLETIRDAGAADRIKVTLGASRHLEAAPTAWPGPVLGQDGSLPVALDAAGDVVKIHAWNKDGIEHGLISGTTGMGKGGTTIVVVLPGVLAGLEVVFYVDGKHGMSAPEIKPLATRLAVEDHQWSQAVDIVFAVMEAREKRYGAANLKRFEVGTNPDPWITLLIDEASTIAGALNTKRTRKVDAIAQRGRAVGIRLIQVSQSVRSDKIVGGVPTRDLLTGGGFSINHKPGGSSAARLATDGIQVAGLVEALQALPGEPGMAVITRRGQVLATQARVFDAETEAIALIQQWLVDGGRPRELAGADLAAAGPVYATWNTTSTSTSGDDGNHGESDASDGAAAGTATGATPATALASKSEQIRIWIIDTLDGAGAGGARGADLEKTPGAPSRATLYRYLSRLQGDGEITNNDGIWRLAGLLPDGDDPDSDDLHDEPDELDEDQDEFDDEDAGSPARAH
jgi:hypothetical protein